MKGMITISQLNTTHPYDVAQQCILYLNRCVAVLMSKALEALGGTVPFTLDLILLKLNGGRYARPIPGELADILVGIRTGLIRGGNSRSGSGGGRKGSSGTG